MKKILFFALLLTALGILAAYFVLNEQSGAAENSKFPSSEKKISLAQVMDSANMVAVFAVGLGAEERRKVISGRKYLNLVQLLKVNGSFTMEQSMDSSCREGARLEFYRDTVLLGEFRLTEYIGRESTVAWKPLKNSSLSKLNKFLRDGGVQVVRCKNMGDEPEALMEFAGKGRPVLTVPEFGAARKAKHKGKNVGYQDRFDLDSSVLAEGSATETPEDNEQLLKDLQKSTQHFLNALDEMILPVDTAVGEPLAVQFKNWNHVEVELYTPKDSSGKILLKTVTLNEKQRIALGNLLKNTVLETYERRGDLQISVNAKIKLFRDSIPEMELWLVEDYYNVLVKVPLVDGADLGYKGFWETFVPNNLRDFFEKL